MGKVIWTVVILAFLLLVAWVTVKWSAYDEKYQDQKWNGPMGISPESQNKSN